ncbi:nucleoside triphosphate pyrophosphohydrolase [Arthrobacter sp. UYCo732]|uniref:nucleoside triphosphate pyrophosphohydrolase n=1 Tax=Arthrobacter sp. UYCo732 TaxID=3156336 RepID=UPI003392B57D
MSDAVKHQKLVRDLIPAIIEANGGTAVTRTLKPEEYRAALHAKLAEESDELRGAVEPDDRLSELADLLEVLKALAADTGYDLLEVIESAAAKSAKRGGLAHRVWLEETRD